MRFSLLFALSASIWCGQAEARTNWIQSPGLPCESVCRHPVTVGGRPDAYVCAGHVAGAPPREIERTAAKMNVGGRTDSPFGARCAIMLIIIGLKGVTGHRVELARS